MHSTVLFQPLLQTQTNHVYDVVIVVMVTEHDPRAAHH